MALEIRETPIGGDLRAFLDVVTDLYRDDPCFVRPLDFDLKDRLSKKNPFFGHAEGTTFTAHRDGKCVGRATAQIDRLHLERYHDDAGFFGFLDTTDDPEVVRALLPHAYRALRVGGPADVAAAEAIPGEHLLVDAKVPGQRGGTGARVDWDLVAPLARTRRLTLAGGLNADNVAEAIARVRPYAVDVASGVEREGDPRRKDAAKVEAFCRAVRGAS